MLVYNDLVDEIKDRYLAHIGGTLDPTDEQIDYWIRQAVQFYMTTLPPIKLADVTVEADYSAMLPQTTARVYFVARDHAVLFPHQWRQSVNAVYLKQGVGNEGDNISVWYQPRYSSTATEIDTDCVFGDDWLKEIVLVRAGQQLQRRDSKRASARGGSKEAQAFRVDGEDMQQLYAMMKAQWDGFFQEMRDKLQTRLAFNDVPMRDSPMQGFVNEARIVWELGAMPERIVTWTDEDCS